MTVYRASNGKIVDTDKMQAIANLDFEGQYGEVRSILYRTRKSHNWYIVSESSWSGVGSISTAEAIDRAHAAAMVKEHCPDNTQNYQELDGFYAGVIDE